MGEVCGGRAREREREGEFIYERIDWIGQRTEDLPPNWGRVALLIMKRKRDVEKVTTEIRAAIEELSLMVKLKPAIVKLKDSPAVEVKGEGEDQEHEDHHSSPPTMPTRPFLSLCTLVVQVLGNSVVSSSPSASRSSISYSDRSPLLVNV